MPDTDFRLSKMRLNDVFYVECKGCRYETVIPQQPLRSRLGPDASIRYLESRLRCTRCKRKWTARVKVGSPPYADPFQAEPRLERAAIAAARADGEGLLPDLRWWEQAEPIFRKRYRRMAQRVILTVLEEKPFIDLPPDQRAVIEEAAHEIGLRPGGDVPGR